MRKNMSLIDDPGTQPLQAFLSDGLQLGDVLERILQFTGPSTAVVSTYSIGEEFLRRCHSLKSKGLLTHMHIIADTKAAEKTARLNLMIEKVADSVRFRQNHSKVMLVFNDSYHVSVLTSQNQTRGNRLENYCIISDPSYLDTFHKELMKDGQ